MLSKYRFATVLFSLLLHGAIAMGAFLFSGDGIVPVEKVYRVSLAEFAAAAPAEAEPPAVMESVAPPQQAPPEPLVPEPAPVIVPEKAKPTPQSKPKPKPEKSQPRPVKKPQQTRPASETTTTQASTAQSGTTGPQPRMVGGLNAYAEDQVDQRPSISRRALPVYPEYARRRNIQGVVVVRIVVDSSGNPQQCAIKSSEPEGVFDESALSAARKTRFIPGKLAGRPVNTVVLLPYRFAVN